jgi:hypothetical protein
VTKPPIADPVSLVLICDCSYLDHAIRFGHDRESDCLTVEVTFEHGRPFWRRIATAWRYVFGGLCAFGSVSEVIVKPEDREQLRAWVNTEGVSH